MMTKNTAQAELVVEREDLKHRIEIGEYKTVIDVILDAVGRIIQKAARRPQSPSFWWSSAALGLLVFLVGLVSAILAGEAYNWRAWSILGVMTFIIVAFLKLIVRRNYSTLVDCILPAVTRVSDVENNRSWLQMAGNSRFHFSFGLGFATLNIIIGLIYSRFVSTLFLMEVSVIIPGYLTLILSYILGYYMALLMNLSLRLSRYRFDLYENDPRSSQVVVDISGMLNYCTFMFVLVSSSSTMSVPFMGIMDITSLIIAILLIWMLMGTYFGVNQYALHRIITRAKRNVLNDVQARIVELKGQDISDQENMEAIMRLWDYHDRIRGTRNWGMNFEWFLSLLNLLLLPLLGPLLIDFLRRLLGL